MKMAWWRWAIVIVSLSLAALMIGGLLYGFAQQPGSGGWWAPCFLVGGIATYMIARSRRSKGARARNAELAVPLAWAAGSAGHWQGLRSDPFDTPGAATPDGSLHGEWRGHSAESIYYQSKYDNDFMTSTHRVELLVVDAQLPVLALAPRRGWSRLDRSDDLDVESAEFNHRFLVSTTELAFAHAILHPRMIERLLRPDARRLNLTFERNVVMTSKWSGAKTARGIEKRMEVLADIADLIPAHVKSQYGSGQEGALGATSAGSGAWSPATRSKRDNWIAWLGFVMFWTGYAPVAIVLADLSLRAYRLQRSTNGALARRVRFWGYLVTIPLLIVALGLGVAEVVWLLLKWAHS
jgi:hypothetical protein